MPEYEFNSPEKKFIRQNWVEFATRINPEKENFSMIALTTESLDDLNLFADNGFYDIDHLESGLIRFNKGRFKCFETKGTTYRKLIKLLPNEFVIPGEIGFEIGKEYNQVFVELGESKSFPCDVINLDFTSSISNVTKRDILNVFKWIFEFQRKYNKDYSLFITFSNTNGENEIDILNKFEEIIQENISNTHTDFKLKFEEKYSSMAELKTNSYNQFLVTGISKFLVKFASENKFKLDDFKFYTYDKERHKMISLLFNFKFVTGNIPPINIYREDCTKCLEDIEEVSIDE